ncbi:hypothetical protein SAMN05444921_11787 [Streptomyces wuyuanensis]|uniref:Uncharacterized protein n=1 Tax=Streptomyces wuyuanensis TaxID=1196353 RepID=A0A1G9Y026_9ACTN|nr:hypothetical protein SAMN05444921_11787 [Streptomyces wuyuanensis]
MQALGWGFPAERFAWAAVELVGDGGQVIGAWTDRSGGLARSPGAGREDGTRARGAVGAVW